MDAPVDQETTRPRGNPMMQKGMPSVNPGGRTKGARDLLSKALCDRLLSDFNRHGVKAIARCRTKRPDHYLKIIAQLCPKELDMRVDIVTRLAALPPHDLERLMKAEMARISALNPGDPMLALLAPPVPQAADLVPADTGSLSQPDGLASSPAGDPAR